MFSQTAKEEPKSTVQTEKKPKEKQRIRNGFRFLRGVFTTIALALNVIFWGSIAILPSVTLYLSRKINSDKTLVNRGLESVCRKIYRGYCYCAKGTLKAISPINYNIKIDENTEQLMGQKTPAVVVMNHVTYVDTVIVKTVLTGKLPLMRFVLADWLMKVPFIAAIASSMNFSAVKSFGKRTEEAKMKPAKPKGSKPTSVSAPIKRDVDTSTAEPAANFSAETEAKVAAEKPKSDPRYSNIQNMVNRTVNSGVEFSQGIFIEGTLYDPDIHDQQRQKFGNDMSFHLSPSPGGIYTILDTCEPLIQRCKDEGKPDPIFVYVTMYSISKAINEQTPHFTTADIASGAIDEITIDISGYRLEDVIRDSNLYEARAKGDVKLILPWLTKLIKEKDEMIKEEIVKECRDKGISQAEIDAILRNDGERRKAKSSKAATPNPTSDDEDFVIPSEFPLDSDDMEAEQLVEFKIDSRTQDPELSSSTSSSDKVDEREDTTSDDEHEYVDAWPQYPFDDLEPQSCKSSKQTSFAWQKPLTRTPPLPPQSTQAPILGTSRSRNVV